MASEPSTIWLTAKLAAERAHVKEVTLRRAVKAGRLKVFPLNGGRRIRFRAADLDAWLSAAEGSGPDRG
jgi:excisionase family DNA binding protein